MSNFACNFQAESETFPCFNSVSTALFSFSFAGNTVSEQLHFNVPPRATLPEHGSRCSVVNFKQIISHPLYINDFSDTSEIFRVNLFKKANKCQSLTCGNRRSIEQLPSGNGTTGDGQEVRISNPF